MKPAGRGEGAWTKDTDGFLLENTNDLVVWLEQTKPGVFVRHTIEMGFPRHATLDVADVDGDGDMDIVTGYASTDKPATSWVQVWINQSKRPSPSLRDGKERIADFLGRTRSKLEPQFVRP